MNEKYELITVETAIKNALECPIRNTTACKGDGTDIECFFCAKSTMTTDIKMFIISNLNTK